MSSAASTTSVLEKPDKGLVFLYEIRRSTGTIVTRTGREQSPAVTPEKLITELCSECAMAKETITYIRVKDSLGTEHVRHYPGGRRHDPAAPVQSRLPALPASPRAALPASSEEPTTSQSGDSPPALSFVRKVEINVAAPKGAVENLFDLVHTK